MGRATRSLIKRVPGTTGTLALLPQTYPANNAADPFHCTVVGTDACAHAMLRFVFSTVSKNTSLGEAFVLPTVDPNSRPARNAHIIDERLRRCVEDEMLMYSTLAYSSSCLAMSIGRYESDKLPVRKIDFLSPGNLHTLYVLLS